MDWKSSCLRCGDQLLLRLLRPTDVCLEPNRTTIASNDGSCVRIFCRISRQTLEYSEEWETIDIAICALDNILPCFNALDELDKYWCRLTPYSYVLVLYSADVPDHAGPVLLLPFVLTAGLRRIVLWQWNILAESLTSLQLSAPSEMALLPHRWFSVSSCKSLGVCALSALSALSLPNLKLPLSYRMFRIWVFSTLERRPRQTVSWSLVSFRKNPRVLTCAISLLSHMYLSLTHWHAHYFCMCQRPHTCINTSIYPIYGK
jgi:hypothetical protein